MSKEQLEILLSLIAYVCFGVAYTLKEEISPSEFLEEMREESPEIDAADQIIPAFVRAVTAFVWTIFMLMWPWYLGLDIGAWIGRNTVGRLVKKWKREDEEEGENHTHE